MDALRKGELRASECWINTIYDNFQDKLLRPDKTKNIITRETILDVLGRRSSLSCWLLYLCMTYRS